MVRGFTDQGWCAHLLTREHAVTNHYNEVFRDCAHTLHADLPVPKDVWFDKMGLDIIDACMRQVVKLEHEHHMTAICYVGWNEFFPRLPLRLTPDAKMAFNTVPCFAIEYAPSFWLKPETRLTPSDFIKRIAKQMVTRLAMSRLRKLSFMVLDERITDQGHSCLPKSLRSRYHVIPDPTPAEVTHSEKRRSISATPLRVLVVGLQNTRKGLIDVIEFVERFKDQCPVHFHLAGRLAKETEHLRSRLASLSPQLFSWTEGFLSEADIQRQYADADYVILPYARSFDCSSSVLATACAHGKPVITTSHGIVGERVRRHSLGVTYVSRDMAALMTALCHLHAPGTSEYATLSRSCHAFATCNSVQCFQDAVFSIISETVQ